MAHGQAPADSAAADAVADGDAVTAVDARAAAGLLPTDELRTLQDGPIPVAPDGLWLGAGRGEGAPAGQTRERARRAGRSRRSRGERAPARGGRLRFLSRLPPGGVRRKEERPFDRGCVPKPAHVAALFGCARRRVRVTTRTRAGSHLAIAAAVPSPAAVPAATPLSSLSTQTPSSLRIRWQLDGPRWGPVWPIKDPFRWRAFEEALTGGSPSRFPSIARIRWDSRWDGNDHRKRPLMGRWGSRGFEGPRWALSGN